MGFLFQEQPTKMQKQELLDRPDIQPITVNQQSIQPERDLLQFFPSRFAGNIIYVPRSWLETWLPEEI